MKILVNITHLFLEHPFKSDATLGLTVAVGLHYSRVALAVTAGGLGEVQSSLASTAVALTGFLVAALTIIITFRTREASTNGQASAGPSRRAASSYARVVQVFQRAIVELMAVFCTLHLSMFTVGRVQQVNRVLLALVALLVIALVVLRCLYVLFLVLDSDTDSVGL